MKGCHVREIVRKDLNKQWQDLCEKRVGKHLCCRDCNNVCSFRCALTFKDCPFYIDKSQLEKVKLAYRLNPTDRYWWDL